MPEEPLSWLDPVDHQAMPKPDAGPVRVVSRHAKVNAVLPSPQNIEAYERSIENGGERVLPLFEGDSAHRHKLERKVASPDAFRANLRLIVRILMANGCSSPSFAAIFQGMQVGGLVGIGSSAALIGGAFHLLKVS